MRKLSACFLIGFCSTLALAQAKTSTYHPHHLFIKMKSGEKLVHSPLIQSSKKMLGDLFLVKTTQLGALEKQLAHHEAIEYVAKDYYTNPGSIPKLKKINHTAMKSFVMPGGIFNDPYTDQLWGFTAQGMDVMSAYASLPPVTPEEVIVAVVDTGVDHNHEDLRDVMWTNTAEIAGDGVDNDHNGYADDIHGINTLVRDTRTGTATVNTLPSGVDGSYHGTHVAGTIGATQNNGIGVAGVASNVKIMAIRTVPDEADELDSNIVEAFQYAALHGAKIINCSFGKKVNEGGMVVRDAINFIGQNYGVLVVAAAGNEHSNDDVNLKYPASFDSQTLLVVAATDRTGGFSYFSNYGARNVDVAAPGSNIFSTLPGNNYGFLDGTSMATPNVVGAAAMVLGYYPQLSPLQLKQILMDSSTKATQYRGKIMAGRVNLKNALNRVGKIR